MRADAKRNYDRLLEAGRAVFREQGYDASLDEVAKRAGVGPGTLYRHFPTRDVLLDAIMQSGSTGSPRPPTRRSPSRDRRGSSCSGGSPSTRG